MKFGGLQLVYQTDSFFIMKWKEETKNNIYPFDAYMNKDCIRLIYNHNQKLQLCT